MIGLLFFAAGLFLRFGSSVINTIIDDVKNSVQNSLDSLSTFGTVDLSGFDITEALLGIALTLIFLGLFLSIVTFLGCCGGCCNVKCMLVTVS